MANAAAATRSTWMGSKCSNTCSANTTRIPLLLEWVRLNQLSKKNRSSCGRSVHKVLESIVAWLHRPLFLGPAPMDRALTDVISFRASNSVADGVYPLYRSEKKERGDCKHFSIVASSSYALHNRWNERFKQMSLALVVRPGSDTVMVDGTDLSRDDDDGGGFATSASSLENPADGGTYELCNRYSPTSNSTNTSFALKFDCDAGWPPMRFRDAF
mmetsp:Transcript_3090/g.8750  ORF Transcript_3090/g.8750 Transcript_3090/m.8750 type:complete len:215 (+) Transcript_3090:509-1153(+)